MSFLEFKTFLSWNSLTQKRWFRRRPAQATMSKRWSCATLMEGYEHVMSDAMADTEEALMKQIEDWILYRS